jgi:hypothetical protein
MARAKFIFAGLLTFTCLAQDFERYPGSRLDEKASREITAPGGRQIEVYTTNDDLDKVYAFYKQRYKEFVMRGHAPKPGQPVKWAFFLIDGAASLSTSTYWMKIQRPYVVSSDGKETRDVTVIDVVRGK